ncbi:TPA: acetamidase, partial [Candidatus Bathyarchaeota archaeon]|nr:acetamidase [Candidatus Bathyarchaeota archaeon]
MIHRFKPLRYYFTFGPNEPALKIKSGDTIITTTVDARGFNEYLEPIPPEMKQKSEGVTFYEGNPLVGPFFVEDAEPGDALKIEIKNICPNRETAWSTIKPHFGSLTEEVPGRMLLLNEALPTRRFVWKLDLKRNIGILKLSESALQKVEVSLDPFIGSIGVAPPYGRVEPASTPGEYGGNMDCVETRQGTILYLPVFVPGAYLAFGDVHAAQGDGELCGTALEVSAEVTVKIDVIKDWTISWP